ncbi:unnamed protein product [Mytilus edulis]|uniref:Endonuclease/exonuclease/phosphatase domain-containing protein n=1 Tax=Mytilus edulis TaxID=6550 RepID=A0A8S3SYV7_MYTED|nr:unnamed protein product [Mytilus edulis]
MRILNGRAMGDSLGNFTYFCPNGRSNIDYVIVSEDIVNSFPFLHVLPPNELSDHCIVWFSLKTLNNLNNNSKQDYNFTFPIPGKFCVENGKNEYISLLENDEEKDIQSFLLQVNDPEKDINTLTEHLTNIMIKAAKKSFKFKLFKKKKKKKKHNWYNGNCFIMKKELRNLGKKMQQYPNNAHIRSNFHRLRKEYNKSLKLARQKFVNDLVTKLDTLHENNPKLFWETIDKLKNKTAKTNPISISDWHKYMNDLYAADKHENPNFIPTAPDFSDTGPLDFPFTCGEVRKGIHKLKNNKQPGIDMIPNEFIKYGFCHRVYFQIAGISHVPHLYIRMVILIVVIITDA